MNYHLKIAGHRFDADQLISALVRYRLLEPLISHVLLDDAIAQVSLSQQDILNAITGMTEIPVPDDFEGFLRRWCELKQVTPEYFNGVLLRDLRIQKFKQLHFAEKVESEFLRIKHELDQVAYSLIQLNDLALAQEVYFQLRDDGAAFAHLAQRYSLGSERETGGWVGTVSLATLPFEISTLFRRQQIGVVYEPVAVGDSFWIVRLERFIAARLTETTRIHLIERMYTQWLQAQVHQAIQTEGAIAVQALANV